MVLSFYRLFRCSPQGRNVRDSIKTALRAPTVPVPAEQSGPFKSHILLFGVIAGSNKEPGGAEGDKEQAERRFNRDG